MGNGLTGPVLKCEWKERMSHKKTRGREGASGGHGRSQASEKRYSGRRLLFYQEKGEWIWGARMRTPRLIMGNNY